jgi:hypothetical protein
VRIADDIRAVGPYLMTRCRRVRRISAATILSGLDNDGVVSGSSATRFRCCVVTGGRRPGWAVSRAGWLTGGGIPAPPRRPAEPAGAASRVVLGSTSITDIAVHPMQRRARSTHRRTRPPSPARDDVRVEATG